ncbi:flotillin family protein [Propionicimonas sp.]|uniref:flotillin family protein n=1 Tax=Propionicimonas sp. TaxID=1955623 RepID=UPI0039E67535
MLDNPIFGIVGILLALALVIWLVASRYRVARPNEAFVITGRGGKRILDPSTGQTTVDLSGQKVVRGGGAFIIPLIQQLSVLDLSSHRIEVGVTGAYNAKGIKLNVHGVAIVKVGATDEAIRAAAQRFNAQQGAIEEFCREVLTGSLRSIIGAMEVDKIISDRAAFAHRVAEASEADLSGQGLIIDTFQIQDIADSEGGTYLRDLGRPEAARIRQQADVAEAEARQLSEQAKATAEQAIAAAQRDLALKRSSIQAETDRASAEAANAGPLEQTAQQQRLVSAQQEVATQQAVLTERQLDATVRRQADAKRYETETLAAAQKASALLAADAKRYETETRAAAEKAAALLAAEAQKAARIAAAEALRAEGEAEGAAKLATGTADADVARAQGEAHAAATLATGSAEADVLDKKAEAYGRYNQAAVLDMVVKVLPEIAHEVAAPMGAIDQLTVISTDGASDLTKKATTTMAELPGVIKQLTGLDITELLGAYAAKAVAPKEQTPAG